MKIKRFVAPDMRQAMRDVREEQGPDAVILSTRRVAEGIEVVAAVDYDEALIREAVRPAPAAPASQPVAPAAHQPEPVPDTLSLSRAATVPRRAPLPPPPPPAARRVEAAAPHVETESAPLPTAARPLHGPARLRRQRLREQAAATPQPPPEVRPLVERAARDTAQLRSELGDLRAMLETQLASLNWNHLEREQPLRARVLRELTRLGIDVDVARQLVGELPEKLSVDQARYLPLGMLSRGLRTSGRSLAGDTRSVVALVGPTGVGKTTTIAKLAARAVMRHGAAKVALVSTDHYRIGAAAQLEHYGRLLGVEVYPAYDAKSLRKVLEMLDGRHTVLIDTAGMAISDPRLNQQFEVLATAGSLRSCLVLAANAHPEALEAAAQAYRALKPEAVILSKLDEAPTLGGALSVLIRHRLVLDYTTDGQRVPEDIAVADARALVCRAAQSLKADAPDDTVMAGRFGLAAVGA